MGLFAIDKCRLFSSRTQRNTRENTFESVSDDDKET